MTALVERLGSLKLAFAGMSLLALAVVSDRVVESTPTWWMVAPLGLLAVNLLAAIASNPRLRRQAGLLVFHVCLLIVLLLIGIGRLTFLDGRVELPTGGDFRPGDVEVRAVGPLHSERWLDRVRFRQGHFTVDYEAGLVRSRTRSQVLLPNGEVGWDAVTVGDTRPLVRAGYRFYTTSNKGYAVLLTWVEHGGVATHGAVHMPSFPISDWNQVNSWTPPQGAPLRLELFLEAPAVSGEPWVMDSRAPRHAGRLKVALESGPERTVAVGDALDLPGGRLRFDGVGAWMGYRISFDPTLPWLLASALLGVGGLASHVWRRCSGATAATRSRAAQADERDGIRTVHT